MRKQSFYRQIAGDPDGSPANAALFVFMAKGLLFTNETKAVYWSKMIKLIIKNKVEKKYAHHKGVNMRREKLQMILFVVLLSAALLLAAPVNSAASGGNISSTSLFADEGEDTLYFEDVTIASSPTDSVRFSIPIRLNTKVEIEAASVNLIYDSDDIRIDSITRTGASWEHININSSRINPDSNLAVIAWIKFMESQGVMPGDSLFGTLWFTLMPGASPQTITIDSTSIPPGGKFLLTESGGFTIIPTYIPGTITVTSDVKAKLTIDDVTVKSQTSDVVFNVPIQMQNQVEITASSINLMHNSDYLHIDSISRIGASWEHININSSRVNPDSNLAVIAWIQFTEPFGVLPGDSLFARLWCTLEAGAPAQVIIIDSLTIPPGGKFTLTDADGYSVSPAFEKGTITVEALGSKLKVSEDSLFYEAATENPPSQTFDITNSGLGDMNWTATPEAGWISVDPGNGTAPSTVSVSVDISGLTEGVTYIDSIKVEAIGAANSPQYVEVVFKVGNYVPEIVSLPATQAVADHPYTYDVETINMPPAQFELVSAPAGMTIVPSTGVINWTPPPVLSDYDVSVRAYNVAGEDFQDYTITVLGYPSTFSSTPITTATLGSPYSYDADATGVPDPWFALSEGPAGMTIDSATGVISWFPDNVGSPSGVSSPLLESGGSTYTEVGHYDVRVEARNPERVMQQFTINLKGVTPKIVSTAPSSPIDKGMVFTYDVNATGKPLPEYFLVEAPEGMTINATNGLINWTTTDYGSYTVVVEARNIVEAPDIEGIASEEFTVNVQAPTAVDDENSSAIPTRASLGNNYPNPFNPSTTIAYAIPENAHVTITVYDILGRKVATLVEGSKSPGYYTTSWDGTNSHGSVVASGVYFYRIKAGDFIETKRMVLQK